MKAKVKASKKHERGVTSVVSITKPSEENKDHNYNNGYP